MWSEILSHTLKGGQLKRVVYKKNLLIVGTPAQLCLPCILNNGERGLIIKLQKTDTKVKSNYCVAPDLNPKGCDYYGNVVNCSRKPRRGDIFKIKTDLPCPAHFLKFIYRLFLQ